MNKPEKLCAKCGEHVRDVTMHDIAHDHAFVLADDEHLRRKRDERVEEAAEAKAPVEEELPVTWEWETGNRVDLPDFLALLPRLTPGQQEVLQLALPVYSETLARTQSELAAALRQVDEEKAAHARTQGHLDDFQGTVAELTLKFVEMTKRAGSAERERDRAEESDGGRLVETVRLRAELATVAERQRSSDAQAARKILDASGVAVEWNALVTAPQEPAPKPEELPLRYCVSVEEARRMVREDFEPAPKAELCAKCQRGAGHAWHSSEGSLADHAFEPAPKRHLRSRISHKTACAGPPPAGESFGNFDEVNCEECLKCVDNAPGDRAFEATYRALDETAPKAEELCARCGRSRAATIHSDWWFNKYPSSWHAFEPAPPKSRCTCEKRDGSAATNLWRDPKCPEHGTNARSCPFGPTCALPDCPEHGVDRPKAHCGCDAGVGVSSFDCAAHGVDRPKAEALDEWTDAKCDEMTELQRSHSPIIDVHLAAIKRRNARIAELESEIATLRSDAESDSVWRKGVAGALNPERGENEDYIACAERLAEELATLRDREAPAMAWARCARFFMSEAGAIWIRDHQCNRLLPPYAGE